MNWIFDGEEQEATMALGTPIWFKYPERSPMRLDELQIHITNLCRYVGARKVTLLDHQAICTWLALEPNFKRFLKVENITSAAVVFQDLIIQRGFVSVHDFPEAVLGDVSTGLKKHLSDYKALEKIWEPWIHEQIGLPMIFRNENFCKAIDITALVLEMRATNHPRAQYYTEKYEPILPEDLEVLTDKALKTLRQRDSTKWGAIMGSLDAAKLKLEQYVEKWNVQGR